MQPRACPSIPWTLRRGMPRVLFTIGVFSASTAAFEEPPSPALCSRLPTEEAGDPTESPTTIPAGARDRSLVPPERARPPSDRVGGSITSVRCLRRDWADRGGAIPLPRQKPSPTEEGAGCSPAWYRSAVHLHRTQANPSPSDPGGGACRSASSRNRRRMPPKKDEGKKAEEVSVFVGSTFVHGSAPGASRRRPLSRCWAHLLCALCTMPQDPNKELLKLHQKHGDVFAFDCHAAQFLWGLPCHLVLISDWPGTLQPIAPASSTWRTHGSRPSRSECRVYPAGQAQG